MMLKRIQCKWNPPNVIAEELINWLGKDGLIWLDGDGSNLGNSVTLAVDPIDEICCRGLPNDPIGQNPFMALRSLEKGHWTGWISYEAAAWIEPSFPWKKNEMATLWIASHDPVLKFDLQKNELWVEGLNEKRIAKFTKFINDLSSVKCIKESTLMLKKNSNKFSIPTKEWEWLTSTSDFSRQVKIIKEWISNGDIFQANITACCKVSLRTTPEALTSERGPYIGA